MPPVRDTAGVVAPPPLLFFGGLALALAFDFGVGRVRIGLPGGVRYGAGAVLAMASVALASAALLRFRRARTAVEPWRPTTALVTDGVFRRTRNPIYLAMALLYAGAALVADSVPALVLLPAVLAVVRVGVIAREERYLERKFGDDYRRYRAVVRRWA